MPSKSSTSRVPRADGARTRREILRVAADLASVEGLDGLTIGKLAARMEMSKSGVFAHFGSKEELQLAAIDVAEERFVEEIVRPALDRSAGIERVWAVVDGYLTYSERHTFSGGCFFAIANPAFAARPGAIRDRLARADEEWLQLIRVFLDEAQDSGGVGDDVDTSRLAFEIASLLAAADWRADLHAGGEVRELARRAIADRLTRSR